MKPEIVKWAKGVGYGGQKRKPKGSSAGGQFAGGGSKKAKLSPMAAIRAADQKGKARKKAASEMKSYKAGKSARAEFDRKYAAFMKS